MMQIGSTITTPEGFATIVGKGRKTEQGTTYPVMFTRNGAHYTAKLTVEHRQAAKGPRLLLGDVSQRTGALRAL